MPYDLLQFYNLDPDDDIEASLRLALMFKEEVDEATRAYMEMLHMTIDRNVHSSEEITQILQEAINAALITGIRTYRSFMAGQGVTVERVEIESGKDIPKDFVHKDVRWPL
jgi:hypothetical protein